MPPDLRLGILVFEVGPLSRWAAFCEHMLGLSAPVIAQKFSGAPLQAKERA
jgi:hypothetical protein